MPPPVGRNFATSKIYEIQRDLA